MELKSKRNLLNHVMTIHEGKKVNLAKRKSKDFDIDNITIKQEFLDSSEEFEQETLPPLLIKTEPPNSDDSAEVKPEKRRKNSSVKSKKNTIKSTKKNLDINEEFNTAQLINIKGEPLEDLDYKCSICLATFSQKSKLKRHKTLTHKGAKKKSNLSKINSDSVSNEIYENQISNKEFLDPNRINIKEEPLDETYDMNTDVFLPDSVKIEPTDENFYDVYDDDPLAS